MLTGEIVSPANDLAVEKAGRTTGTTFGFLNSILADVWTKVSLAKDERVYMTREWAAISSSGINTSLSGKGDSGSLLVTKHIPRRSNYYDVVGQMFSGGIRLRSTPTKHWGLANYDITIMTPAKDILKSLSEAMGEEFEFVSGL